LAGVSKTLTANARYLARGRAPALVVGTGSNGISFIKSLGRKGVPVIAMDTWMQAGMFSRYCLPLVLPDPAEAEEAFLTSLREIGEALPVRGVLITTTDASALLVSKHRSVLSRHFDFTVADHDTIRRLANKKLQYEDAQRLGIAIPATHFPSEVPIEEIAREIPYPCIIKPNVSHLWGAFLKDHAGLGWGKAREARSPAELIRFHEEMETSGVDLMVQERIGGGDDQLYGLLTYLNGSSEPMAVFTKRKLRQFPRYYGNGSVQVGLWEPEVAELGLRLLRGLKYRGIAGVEFKRDPRDGAFKLMEINPRSISQTYHAVASGVDVPYVAYCDARGEKVPTLPPFREGVKWISFEKDLQSFLQYRRDGDLELSGWLRSWRGERCYAYFTWDDPLPAVAGLWQFARSRLPR